MATAGEKFLLVAAIDFGTTFSGYSFSFTSSVEDSTRHEQIRINKSWGASLGFQSYKTPTSVLTDKSGKFLAFGFEAEQKYSQAQEGSDRDSDGSDSDSDGREAKEQDMLLFRHFKMMLHKQEDVKRNAAISAVDGTIRPALDIFAHALKYLKGHMLNAIQLESGSIPLTDDILWVISVPAIWSETSKQFMREAAQKAGCIVTKDSKRLVIALEPEAASLCCRRLNIASYADSKGISFPTGTKYLVLDCGGGTIDITAHVMEFDKKVKELLSASGGPWGGTKVDKRFVELIESALGKDFLNKYRQKYPQEWLRFITEFEQVKKAFKPDGESRLCIPVPYNMAQLYPQVCSGKKIEKALKSVVGMSFSSGMITVNYQTAKIIFEPIVDEIVQHVSTLTTNPKLKGLKYILMVGGFSECELLQKAIKDAFERNGTRVLIPSEAQLAIIKGAVLFGHIPNEITERILTKTYGCGVWYHFDAFCHDVSRKFQDGAGQDRVKVFRTIAEKGSSIALGSKIIASPLTKIAYTNCVIITIFVTDSSVSGIRYVDEPCFTKVGAVTIRNLKVGKKSSLELYLIFGATEIKVEATDLETGHKATTEIDFLS